MSKDAVYKVIQNVRGGTLDCKTGIILLSREYLGKENSLGTRYNLSTVDFVSWYKQFICEGEEFLRLNENALLNALDKACSNDFATDCLLVYNFDLGLSSLPFLERGRVWSFLRNSFRKRPRGLIVSMPKTATRLLPNEMEQAIWQQGNRIAYLG